MAFKLPIPISDVTNLQSSLDLKSDLSVSVNNQTGTTYTLVIGDAGKVVEMNNAAAITLTVPTNASVAFAVGTVMEIWQQGDGQVKLGGAPRIIWGLWQTGRRPGNAGRRWYSLPCSGRSEDEGSIQHYLIEETSD